jgi:hypothetical protein
VWIFNGHSVSSGLRGPEEKLDDEVYMLYREWLLAKAIRMKVVDLRPENPEKL